jgi:hypothetical protein
MTEQKNKVVASAVCRAESMKVEERNPPFTCWRSKFLKESYPDGRCEKYEWSEESRRQTSKKAKLIAEVQQYFITCEKTIENRRCSGSNGRCYILVPYTSVLPETDPIGYFIRPSQNDPFQIDCRCKLQKCRNFLVCGNHAPGWYMIKNDSSCPECVYLRDTFVKEVSPCNSLVNSSDDDTYDSCVEERKDCIAEPYLFQFDVANTYHACNYCNESDYDTRYVTFSNCHHRLCYECACTESDERLPHSGQIVCLICVTYFLATCICGRFELCDGRCMRLFLQEIPWDPISDDCRSPADYNTVLMDRTAASIALYEATINALNEGVVSTFLHKSTVLSNGRRVYENEKSIDAALLARMTRRDEAIKDLEDTMYEYIERTQRWQIQHAQEHGLKTVIAPKTQNPPEPLLFLLIVLLVCVTTFCVCRHLAVSAAAL